MSSGTALIIEDDHFLHPLLRDALTDAGLDSIAVTTAQEALSQLETVHPALILLDLGLPDMDGLDVCRRLREHSAVPVIVLSGRRGEIDRVVGLEVGADDYLVKPFGRAELVARIRALLRRATDYAQRSTGREMLVGAVSIRRDRRTVICREEHIALTPKEFDLLCALASRPDEVVPSRELLWEVWQYPDGIRTRTLDVHIGRLRGKLERDRKHPEILITVPGVGYKLDSAA